MLKIVHIITRLILGGAQENTLITCKLLAERGHDVTLITGPAIGPEGELFNQTKNQKYKVIVINQLRRAIKPIKDFISYRKIKKYLRQLQPDIVHTHSAKAGILGRFAGYRLKGEWGQNLPAVVHTIHGLAFHPYQNSWLNKFYIAVEKSAAKRTDYFISVADAMTNQALAAGIGRPEQFVTTYSAIEEDDFLQPIPQEQIKEFRCKYEIPEESIVLVTIARLFMLKGHDYIIESAKQLSKQFENVFWLFVGDGNLSDDYKQQVQQLGLDDRIKFAGLLPPSQIPLAIASSDILVHCSLREGLARTLPQAMLCGKPAISFDVDGAREVVNENTGRLIEPKNVEQLIEACAELIKGKDLREKLGIQGREFVKEKFAPETMVDTIETVYKKLIQKHPKGKYFIMSTNLRACWQNCYTPDDKKLLKDKELLAINAMEDSIAPLDDRTIRIRQLITRFEACYHEADKEAERIIKAISTGRCPKESNARPPKRKEELQNAHRILSLWCKNPATTGMNLDVGGIPAEQLSSFIGKPNPLKAWQVERVIDRISQALNPNDIYHWLTMDPVGLSDQGKYQPEKYHKNNLAFLEQTKKTFIHDTVDGRKSKVSLAIAIDLLMPCHWDFVGGLVIILKAIGGNLYPDKPYACCARNIKLSPLCNRLKIISRALGVFWKGDKMTKTVDHEILASLGEATPVKRWLAASLDKTIRLHLTLPFKIDLS
jgi:glycosyltransferase involved in cell wall biosynthesis